MTFDAKQFFIDYGIDSASEGNKHTRQGWVQVPCPFCSGNPGYHLGFNLAHDYFNCWRCGFHPITKVIRTFAVCSWHDAKQLKKQYRSRSKLEQTPEQKRIKQKKLKLPSNMGKLGSRDFAYMERRGFDPYHTMGEWGIVSSGPTGGYKHRILIPIHYNNVMVSYQGRDTTGKSRLRYKACKKSDELIHHQSILYGLDKAKKGDTCILVEGVTDVWRMGPGSVSCFGIATQTSQITLLAENFTRVFVMFDDDPQARREADKIGSNLSVLGVEVEICVIDGDPAELPQATADEYRAELFK